MSKYWKNIAIATKTLKDGLKVTFEHMRDAVTQRDPLYVDEENYFKKQNGIFATQYPKEIIPVPDNGRYKLHNEIEDCIVCDKCAKICPVDCIDIEPVRAVEEFGKTSDGTPKRIYAAKFDIDMAKCCFCGLCTTVCPTESLTMTKEYDFSAFDFAEHNFVFGEMTPLEILEKKQALEEFNKKKEEERAKMAAFAASKPATEEPAKPAGAKPVFRPKMMKPKTATTATEENTTDSSKPARPKVVMKPKIQPKVTEEPKEESKAEEAPNAARPKIPMKPKIPSAPKTEASEEKSLPRVVIRPKIHVRNKAEESSAEEAKPKPRPIMRPKIQPRKMDDEDKNETKD
ncbi:4Fe-4S dicluster domain-containing protein [Roseivirga echinicomitans]